MPINRWSDAIAIASLSGKGGGEAEETRSLSRSQF